MELLIRRRPQTDGATLGEFYVNGVFECFSLEPDDDGEHPAIPTGRYQVTINKSTRFGGRMLPLVMRVPGRIGIRFHPGNTTQPYADHPHGDTEGCILLGTAHTGDVLHHSRVAVEDFQAKLARALAAGEEAWLTVEPVGIQLQRA
jgi:hypothetical protein